MPIKPELRHLYPDDWQDIRAEILERAGNCCEDCGIKDGLYGFRDAGGMFTENPGPDDSASDWYCNQVDEIDAKEFTIVLTVGHLDHDPTNNGTPGNRPNLRAMCQQCHNRHDAFHRAVSRSKTRDKKRGQERFPGPLGEI